MQSHLPSLLCVRPRASVVKGGPRGVEAGRIVQYKEMETSANRHTNLQCKKC